MAAAHGTDSDVLAPLSLMVPTRLDGVGVEAFICLSMRFRYGPVATSLCTKCALAGLESVCFLF